MHNVTPGIRSWQNADVVMTLAPLGRVSIVKGTMTHDTKDL